MTSFRTIWKFNLPLVDWVEVPLPAGAEVLQVGVQDDNPVIWALVDPSRPIEGRGFWIVGTGNPMPDGVAVEHRGSFQLQLPGGEFVGHVFEELSS